MFGLEKPVIDYTYVIDGAPYRGDRVSIGPDLDSWAAGERRERVFREGAQIRVYYDPANPHRSVLEPGVNLRMVAYHAFFAIVGMGVAVFLAVALGAA